jgi:hypothetical protein
MKSVLCEKVSKVESQLEYIYRSVQHDVVLTVHDVQHSFINKKLRGCNENELGDEDTYRVI